MMKAMKKVIPILLMAALVFGASALIPETMVSAAGNPWDSVGVDANANFEEAGLYDDIGVIMGFIIALGGFWVIGCLVFAGMKLSGSSGNAQKRTEGFVALGLAFVGGFVIVKAYDIAGYIQSFGLN